MRDVNFLWSRGERGSKDLSCKMKLISVIMERKKSKENVGLLWARARDESYNRLHVRAKSVNDAEWQQRKKERCTTVIFGMRPLFGDHVCCDSMGLTKSITRY